MGLTWLEVCEMEAGGEMDALVGKVFGFEPHIQWWAMDKEEEGVFISFEWKSDASEWMNDQIANFPAWVIANGCHLVKKEIYQNYSESISAAWEVVKQLSKDYGVFVYEDEGAPCECKLHKWSTEPTYSAEAETSPLAICRAALLTTLKEA